MLTFKEYHAQYPNLVESKPTSISVEEFKALFDSDRVQTECALFLPAKMWRELIACAVPISSVSLDQQVLASGFMGCYGKMKVFSEAFVPPMERMMDLIEVRTA